MGRKAAGEIKPRFTKTVNRKRVAEVGLRLNQLLNNIKELTILAKSYSSADFSGAVAVTPSQTRGFVVRGRSFRDYNIDGLIYSILLQCYYMEKTLFVFILPDRKEY